jgi:hypothetical protein
MGAHSRFATVERCSLVELERRFHGIVEAQQYEDGHDAYAGTFGSCSGLQVTSQVFADEGAASSWILDNAEKWGKVLAVKVGDFNAGYFGTKTGQALLVKHAALAKELEEFDSALVKRVKEGKSKFRSCPKCESKVAVKYIGNMAGLSPSQRDAYCRPTACPVCGSEFIRTPTDQKRYDALKKRYEATSSEVRTKKQTDKTGKSAYWLLGAIVAS